MTERLCNLQNSAAYKGGRRGEREREEEEKGRKKGRKEEKWRWEGREEEMEEEGKVGRESLWVMKSSFRVM